MNHKLIRPDQTNDSANEQSWVQCDESLQRHRSPPRPKKMDRYVNCPQEASEQTGLSEAPLYHIADHAPYIHEVHKRGSESLQHTSFLSIVWQ